MNRYFGILGFFAIVLIAGCGSAPVREPPAPLPEFKAEFRVQEIWSVDVGAQTKDRLGLVPKVRDGLVYAAGPDGNVDAVNAETGKRLWDVHLGVPVGGAVGVGERIVTCGTLRGDVIALKRDTGVEAWRAAVSSEVLSPPVVAGDIVIVQAADGSVFGLSAESGERRWVYVRTEPSLSLRGVGEPLVVDNAVLVGFASGKVVVLDVKDGHLLWETTVSQPRGRNEIERLVDVDASPLVYDGVIYAASYQGKLVAINPRNGNVIWSRDISTYTGLVTDGTNIYVTDEKGHVLAFDRQSGASVWRQDALHGRWLSPPVVQGNFVVVGDYEGYVHWLARDDGHFVARYQVDGNPIRAAAVVAGQTLFIASTSGTLAALRLVQK